MPPKRSRSKERERKKKFRAGMSNEDKEKVDVRRRNLRGNKNEPVRPGRRKYWSVNNIHQTYCSAWLKSKLNTKIGLHTTTTHPPPPTTNFSPRRGCRKVPKFYVGT